MTLLSILPVVSTVISAVFAIALFFRYSKGGRSYTLLWGIGVVFYGLGTLSEAVLGLIYSPLVLKLWYVTGAMLTAAWLGQGTVHLLVRRGNVARNLTVGLALVSLLAIALVFSAPTATAAYDVARPASLQYRDILTRSGLTVLLTVMLNVYGSITLIGGAVWSAWLFWRKRVLPNRVVGNVLIALGAMMPAIAGSMLKVNRGDVLYESELLGILVMYAGFLQAIKSHPAEEASPASAQTV